MANDELDEADGQLEVNCDSAANAYQPPWMQPTTFLGESSPTQPLVSSWLPFVSAHQKKWKLHLQHGLCDLAECASLGHPQRLQFLEIKLKDHLHPHRLSCSGMRSGYQEEWKCAYSLLEGIDCYFVRVYGWPDHLKFCGNWLYVFECDSISSICGFPAGTHQVGFWLYTSTYYCCTKAYGFRYQAHDVNVLEKGSTLWGFPIFVLLVVFVPKTTSKEQLNYKSREKIQIKMPWKCDTKLMIWLSAWLKLIHLYWAK